MDYCLGGNNEADAANGVGLRPGVPETFETLSETVGGAGPDDRVDAKAVDLVAEAGALDANVLS